MGRIEAIKYKLAELRNLDKRFSVYGSTNHKYEMNGMLSESDIRKMEHENNITLTDEYRQILMHLGNGGAGSGNGLERINLEKAKRPYKGTAYILRNCKDPSNIDCGMVNTNDITGYIKLFDYGCGMETSLIVKGKEQGDLIFYDCDGRFEKLTNKSILNMFDNWLDENLAVLKRIKNKLLNYPIHEVIDSEWKSDNFRVHGMVYSIMNIATPEYSPHTEEYKKFMEEERLKWMAHSEKEDER